MAGPLAARQLDADTLAGLPAEALACLPERLHPVSRYFLDKWLDGTLTTPEFLRWFHMPNSDYLEAGRCLLNAITGG
ncbi:MAG: hypothetical protein WD100_04400 [Tistlia sp.]|uniref:hypothetical protein n=1 Tax=Tistlia sp. TaxID=3057121 RepID=UPI0034A0F56D